MPSNIVKTRIGQFEQPSTTGTFAAISADAFYLSGTSLSASVGGGSITGGANTGVGIGVYSFTGNANLIFKSLSAGKNTMVRDDTSLAMITFGELSGADINFVGISGTTVTVDSATNSITINGSGSAAADIDVYPITGGANTGTGIGLFSSTANLNVNIKSLSADAGIIITNLGASVSISASLSAGANIGITQYGNTLSISGSSAGGGGSDGVIAYLAL